MKRHNDCEETTEESAQGMLSNDTSCSKCTLWNSSLDLNCMDYAMTCAAGMLEQDAQRWISVKDKLPNDDATYIACGCDGYLLADYAGDGEWESFDLTNVTRYVSYWMPLPKEPEEEEK